LQTPQTRQQNNILQTLRCN